MKFEILLSLFAVCATAEYNCTTNYNAWNRDSSYTTSTIKTKVNSTSYVFERSSYTTYISSTTITVPSTSTSTFTIYSTIASTTVTIPTSPGLIPFASATAVLPDQYTKRVTGVTCISTVSIPTLTTTLTFRLTTTYTNPGTVYTTTLANSTTLLARSTILTPTATIYQACRLGPPNQATAFGPRPLFTVVPLNVLNGYYPAQGLSQKQSPELCCDAVMFTGAQNPNISGYVFFPAPQPAVRPWEAVCGGLGTPGSDLLQGWQFFLVNSTGPTRGFYVGTGPRNPQRLVYGGLCDEQGVWGTCQYRNQA